MSIPRWICIRLSNLVPIGPVVWKLSQIYELMTPMPLGYQGVICFSSCPDEYAYMCAKFGPDRSRCLAFPPHFWMCDPLTPSKYPLGLESQMSNHQVISSDSFEIWHTCNFFYLESRLHTYFNPGQASTLGAIAVLKGELKNNPGYIWLHYSGGGSDSAYNPGQFNSSFQNACRRYTRYWLFSDCFARCASFYVA